MTDVARALWFVAATKEEKGGRSGPVSAPEIFNIVDDNDTDQGAVNTIIEEIYGIETGFEGTVVSSFAKVTISKLR